jgi:hypothetical protein
MGHQLAASGNARGDIKEITPYQVVDNPKLLTAFANGARIPPCAK